MKLDDNIFLLLYFNLLGLLLKYTTDNNMNIIIILIYHQKL